MVSILNDDELTKQLLPIPGLTVGRMVHFVMPDGKHRPAVIVHVWNTMRPGTVNLQVFTDGLNDRRETAENESTLYNDLVATGILWRSSIVYSETPEINTWHFPEYVP